VILVQAALLGIVQGLTEFLPVSSSAHLILARAFFNWDSDQFGLGFDVACHVGTLLAVVAYFAPEMRAMIASVPAMFRRGMPPPAQQAWLIVIGTVPAVIVGLLFGDFIEARLRTPVVAGSMLALGAAAMLVAERTSSRIREEASITPGEAFAIGCAQAAALVPGVSRSGATMTLAMFLGLRRDAAARFVFLLGVPAILASAVVEGLKLRHEPAGPDAVMLFAVGIAASAVVGYLAVRFFITYISRHSLDVFAWYRLALAAMVVVWLLARA
jgi:undecaprenyl-diphosphatase